MSFGLVLDDQGSMSLDESLFEERTASGLSALTDWLGSKDSGGFLKSAFSQIAGLTDSQTGVIDLNMTSLEKARTNQDERLEAEQERIDALRAQFEEQFAAADALIANLEQQASYISRMFEAMRISSESLS
jgi:flagellar capping protein FliD